jgi:uroporphyrinogen III methyltransferase/synthase
MRNLPLAGKRILITRARSQSTGFGTALRAKGAEVIEFPMIEIVPPLRWNELDRSLNRFNSYAWIIFTSANGVKFFLQRLKEKKIRTSLPPSLRVCAIGPATAKELKEKKVRIDFVPREYVAEAILEGFEKMSIRGKRILLARAKVARDVLPRGLRQMGAEVDVVEVYRTLKPRGGAKKLRKLLTNEKVDVLTFTSSSTVSHFADLLRKEDLGILMKNVTIACIGPITARTALEWGMKVHIQPREYTIPALTQAIVEYFQKNK